VGTRVSTSIQRVDNSVESGLFGLHRLRHIIEPAATVSLAVLAPPPLLAASLGLAFPLRAAAVVAFVAPLATLLGFCFPIGMRLVGALSPEATAWMWGVNGACGVLASIAAVLVSVSAGISTNLLLAAALYALLALPAHALARRAAAA